jgi:hypothetical protein
MLTYFLFTCIWKFKFTVLRLGIELVAGIGSTKFNFGQKIGLSNGNEWYSSL